MNEETMEGISQYLTFTLEDGEYAMNVTDVREVLERQSHTITKIPRTPDYVKGVINVRGSVVPIIDMRLKFNMGATEETIDTCIIIIEAAVGDETEGNAIILGVLADSVKEVIDLTTEMIEEAPEIGTSGQTDFIAGIGKKGNDRFILILKTEKILTTEELMQVQKTANGSAGTTTPSPQQEMGTGTVSA